MRFCRLIVVGLFLSFCLPAIANAAPAKPVVELTRDQIEEIVLRSYQYVTMFNVNNKFAFDPTNPMATGGYNRVKANTRLADHTLKAIPRPNNDTLYIGAMLDLRTEPMILEAPAFDSRYVSLMVTGYDHYVNIPMSKRLGDFSTPSRILFYTARTHGYEGEPVPGVDKVAEMTGDFVSAVYRIMPHVTEPDRLQRILDAMESVRVVSLSEFQSGHLDKTAFSSYGSPDGISRDIDARLAEAVFPDFGRTDFDVFENNLLEVMQFVFNHQSFDPDNELDQKLLAVYAPLGVAPGRSFDPRAVADIDGALFREVAESVAAGFFRRLLNPDPEMDPDDLLRLFLPKGEMTLERLVGQSVVGPIGQPAAETVYPPVTSSDGQPMNARHDYVIRMTKDELPPAHGFWSATLYDTEYGFFIPNDRKKYSVGENGGYKLNAEGGIEIHIAAEQPEGVAEENWLPINRGDYGIDVIMRIYAPDLERYRNWQAPKTERVD